MNSRTTALIPANNAGIGSTDDWVPDLFGQLMKTQQEKTKASQTDRQAGHDLNDRATKLYEDYNNIQQVLQSGQVTYGSQAYVDLSTTAQDLRNQAQDLDKQHVKKIIDSAQESGQSTQLQQDAMTLAQHISPQSPPLPQNQLQTQCPSFAIVLIIAILTILMTVIATLIITLIFKSGRVSVGVVLSQVHDGFPPQGGKPKLRGCPWTIH
ncbi:hypothetical protein H2204_013387 [Knufia peltigerae]|uniref:Uncharacterized protein n=1 Tax=Knufia peltigerae TaxID=1002370 RepID=A0AA38XQM8_9EURO|nr:hypothetical protein H2204_013387 [Knufia peltigerae]